MLVHFSLSSLPSMFSLLPLLPLLLLLLAAGSNGASQNNVHIIRTPSDLIKLSNDVLNGTTYSGTTVYLDSDLDFSGEQFTPIGDYDIDMQFNGTFDGQGHTISNLNVLTSSDGVGLFELSYGPFYAKNFVLDSSCSFTCNHTSENTYNPSVGSVIGALYSLYGPCTVESIVNMASVSYTGSVTGSRSYTLIGGFAGLISYHYEGDIIVRNCINYGTIISSGVSSSWMYIGGISGQVWGRGSVITTFIQNCLNYGTIIYNGTTDNLLVGGISGENTVVSFTNCVSAGRVEVLSSLETMSVKGIVGLGRTSVTVTHCFWTSDMGCESASGSSDSVVENSSLVTMNSTTVNELNEYASSNNWTMWLLNTNNASVTFEVGNGTKDITFSSQLILLPDLAGTGNETRFSGWHKDPNLFNPLSEYEVNGDTKFYSAYDVTFIVFFYGNGGNSSAASKVVKTNNKYGDLPSANMTGNTFAGWFTDAEGGEEITSETIVALSNGQTLYVHWTINNYTVIFDLNNGSESKEVTLEFGKEIPYPAEPVKEGHSFNGWSETITFMPAHNLTITAQWTINNYTITFDFGNGTKSTASLKYGEPIPYPDVPEKNGYVFEWTPRPEIMPDKEVEITGRWIEVSNYVKITFATKDLSEKEVREMIIKYTDEEFIIERFGSGSDGAFVIIMFNDVDYATEFVKKASESSDELMKGIEILSEYNPSLSSILHPIFSVFFI